MIKYFEKAFHKLKEEKGGIYLIMMYFILLLTMLSGLFVEYNRVTHIIKTIDLAYERALTAVAISNYNEIYESLREENIFGGRFKGGNEGKFDKLENPSFFDDQEYGEIEDELINLLQLKRKHNEDKLIKKKKKKKLEYSIENIEVGMLLDDSEIDGKYKIVGSADVTVPLYFLGRKIISIPIKVESSAKWRTKW